MLTIRLQRVGKRNQPEYRIVLAEKPSAVTKKFIEVLGNYNPRTKDFNITDQDRLQYWIKQHVELSPTIHNLFITKNLIDAPKRRAFAIPKKVAEPAAAAPSAPAETPAVGTPAETVPAAKTPPTEPAQTEPSQTDTPSAPEPENAPAQEDSSVQESAPAPQK